MSARAVMTGYIYGGDNVRKEEMVNRINDLLEMEHRLSVWQFLSVRKYELGEMTAKIESLYERAHGRAYGIEIGRSLSARQRVRYRPQTPHSRGQTDGVPEA